MTKSKHKYTNTERSKVYQTKKIKNVNKKTLPKAKTDTTRKERAVIVFKHFKAIKGKTYYCPALKDYVSIGKKTYSEARIHTISRAKSTEAALNVENVIKNATLIYDAEPKKTKSQSAFKRMYVLICPITGVGYAKLTIGRFYEKKENEPDLQVYCITQISLYELKNKK